MPVAQALLSANNIHKRFRSGEGYLEVLKGVSVCVQPRQLAVLSGPSGSGKSTLLYILGGLEKPESGKIIFKDEAIDTYNNDRIDNFRNEKIGFVFQLHYLLPDFTAIENIMIPAMVKGLS
jgi:lipoprotein-releasing system ATP-binding protein